MHYLSTLSTQELLMNYGVWSKKLRSMEYEVFSSHDGESNSFSLFRYKAVHLKP